MNRVLLLLLLLVMVFILSGCATPNVSKSYFIDSANKNGLVIGSITRSKSSKGHQGFSVYVSDVSVHYRGLDNDVRSWVNMDSWLLGGLYGGDFNNIDGEIFVIELEPGSYEIYSWGANQGWYTYIKPKLELSLPFEVKQGKAVYIGELNLDLIFGKNIFGIGIVGGAEFNVRDSYERDSKVIKEKYPNIDLADVERAILSRNTTIQDGVTRDTMPIILPIPRH